MNVRYLIAGPGRTGSVFVSMAIQQASKLKIIHDLTPNKDKISESVIYHTHHANLQLDDTNNLTVVCVTRKNLYAGVISAILAEGNKEWSDYSGTKPPFVATRDLVEQKYVWQRWWHHQFNSLTNYKNKIYLEFDDFIKNNNIIFDSLNLPVCKVPVKKSPYDENHILNLKEVNTWFDELENDALLEYHALNTFTWSNNKTND